MVIVGALVGLAAALAAAPQPASAHPLGNFSVNQLAALDLYPDRVEVAAAVDIAELPTTQELATVDQDGDGTASVAEREAYAETSCAALARDFEVSVAGDRLVWTVTPQWFGLEGGAAGLATSRLDCSLVAHAQLDAPTTISVTNRFRDDRVGWRELTAVGHGVRLVDSPLPARSVSDGLRAYPQDLLSAPLDVRSAELRVEPGEPVASDVDAPAASTGPALTRWLASAEQTLHGFVGNRLTPLVGGLAVLLALALGAAHAALPGHGKTVMAAYLAGRRGRPRDAVAVGATVTLTHTGGVLVLGMLLTTVAGLAGEAVLGWLGVASGALVVVLGVAMFLGARRRHHHHHHHHHHHDHHHDHDHDHGRPSRLSILGIGIAGGLVPSPSALVVLLGAIGLGRTAFGVLLVIAYGTGMAATLTAAGLLLIRLRDRWAARRRRTNPRWPALGKRLSAAAPTATAGMVLLVGLGLASRAVFTLA
jgi:ABC-type nickel/cobalt efflux system permease component RcnA